MMRDVGVSDRGTMMCRWAEDRGASEAQKCRSNQYRIFPSLSAERALEGETRAHRNN